MWNLFLGGHNNQSALRPFGDITLDGVDLDIENQDPKGYNGFVDQIQKNFRSDKSHHYYYITAAPQCPRNGGTGDASLEDDVLKKTDAVWVQFYNNPQCNHGSSGFMASVQDWAAAIAPAQLWIGAPDSAGKESATNGFPDIPTTQNEVKQIYGLKNATNIGGWMLWDASTAMANQNYQQEVAKAIKADNTTVSRAQRRMHF
jgi:chitinase